VLRNDGKRFVGQTPVTSQTHSHHMPMNLCICTRDTDITPPRIMDLNAQLALMQIPVMMVGWDRSGANGHGSKQIRIGLGRSTIQFTEPFPGCLTGSAIGYCKDSATVLRKINE